MAEKKKTKNIPATIHAAESTRRSANASTAALSRPDHFVSQGPLFQLIFASFQLLSRSCIVLGTLALLHEDKT